MLVNNAAIPGPQSRTVDGNELTFQVNYLAAFLLTRLLTPQLSAAHGRVVTVSSTLHRTGNINWSDPQRHKLYSPVAAYAQSKLALSMFARAIAIGQANITAVSVHPGIVTTDMLPMHAKTGAPVADAAAVVAELSRPDTDVVNGAYYDGFSPAHPAPLVDNDEAVLRLWKLTTRLVGPERFLTAKAA